MHVIRDPDAGEPRPARLHAFRSATTNQTCAMLPSPSKAAILVLTLALVATACRPDNTARPSDQPSPADTEESSAAEPPAPRDQAADDEGPDDPDWEGTTSEIRQEQAGDYANATLTDVRFGPRASEDRAVFEFTDAIPGFTVRFTDQPTECGSGRAVDVAGDYFLEVSMSPAAAHDPRDDDRRPTIEMTERTLQMPRIQGARQTCDHHAGVTWVLGLSERAPFRVLDLENPYRIVVDVRR